MKLKAFAKINLSLDVTGKRPDGYHTLSSVFQSVTLCDTVEINKSDTVSVKCSNGTIEGEKNLCYKAALRFFEAARLTAGAEIFIEKQIPLAAGLGGGSTDAGAVLIGLNELYGRPLTTERLLDIGVTLGADVPFCMLGGTKLCEGIGEIMTELPKLPECYIVIAKKGQKGSTGEMYRALDENSDTRKRPDNEKFISGLKVGSLIKALSGAYNCFESVCDKAVLNEARAVAKLYDAVYCGLSGAGPSAVAVFDNTDRALKALDCYQTYGFEAFLTEPTETGNKIIE